MLGDRYVILEVAYEPELKYGRSLQWVAPELNDAGLIMTEDHTNESRPSRTWEGIVDGATFTRFARAWNIDSETDPGTPTETGRALRDYTFDGMNWEADGESPIVYVAVHVSVAQMITS